MAKADTLTFSRRVKDLIWMEINFISQILGYYSKPDLVLFCVLFRISMILIKDQLCYTMTFISYVQFKITEICVCKQCIMGPGSM